MRESGPLLRGKGNHEKDTIYSLWKRAVVAFFVIVFVFHQILFSIMLKCSFLDCISSMLFSDYNCTVSRLLCPYRKDFVVTACCGLSSGVKSKGLTHKESAVDLPR